MEKNYKVIVSAKAKELLANHIRFMAEYDINAARKVKEQLIFSLTSLSTLPNRFPFFNEDYIPQNKYHKMFVEKWYLVLYQIKDDAVFVDYILDCRSDYQWLLK